MSLWAAPWAAGATGGSATSRLLKSSLSAARAEHWVEWRGTTTGDGQTIVESTNAGVSAGNQTVTITVTGGSSGTLSIVLEDDVAYIEGNNAAALIFQGFTAAAATAEATRWIAVPSNTSLFQVVAAGLTVKSTVSELALTGRLRSAGTSRVLGQDVRGIKGTFDVPGASGPGLLYVRTRGTPLPVEEKTKGGGSTATVDLVRWNHPVTLGPPPTSVPFNPAWLQPSSSGGSNGGGALV